MHHEYSIAPEDFDVTLLPPAARRVGTPEFDSAVSDFFKNEFSGFGGSARIVVSEKAIRVSWDAEGTEPLEVAIETLGRGRFREGIQLLELLRSKSPDDPAILYNLGVALSEAGQLDRAVGHLRRMVRLDARDANGRVALGVALTRQDKTGEAIGELRQALKVEPENPFALRNLGACLLKSRAVAEAEECFRRAVGLSPRDQQAWFGLAEAVYGLERLMEADGLYRKVVEVEPTSDVAEVARQRLRGLAQETFRSLTPGVERIDAVMYLAGAIETFEKMSPQEVQRIGFEIATLGMKGFDFSDSAQKYQLASLPGRFSGLHMVSLMYAAFKVVAPGRDIGFDLSKEYALAMGARRDGKDKP